MPTLITTRQAAELCDVHASTVKRWCDAGDLTCQHTPGGHRRIDLDVLLAFATHRGLPTALDPFGGQAAAVWQAATDAVDRGLLEPMVELWWRWLERDEPAYLAPSMLLLHRWGLALSQLFDRGLQPLMHRIGEAWHRGHLRIGDEHRSSEQVMDALHRLRLGLPRLRSEAPMALVAAAPGNRHRLGAFMVRLLLESEGWSVRYLGADVPADEISVQQRACDAELVCVSFSAPLTAGDAWRLVEHLAGTAPVDRPYHLVLGGTPLLDRSLAQGTSAFRSCQVLPTTTALAGWLEQRRTTPEPVPAPSMGGTR